MRQFCSGCDALEAPRFTPEIDVVGGLAMKSPATIPVVVAGIVSIKPDAGVAALGR